MCEWETKCLTLITSVSLSYLCAGLLDPLGELVNRGRVCELARGLALGQQRDDGDARVASDDGHLHRARVHAVDLTDEG